MASLLTSASPFNSGKKGKMPARMSKTFQRLTSVDEHEPKLLENFSDPNASNDMSSIEKQIESQKIREEKVQQALNKITSANNDESTLGNFTVQPEMASRVPETHFPPVPVAPPTNTSQSSSTPRDKIEGFSSGALSTLGTMQSRTGSSYQQSYGPTEYSQQLTSKNNHIPVYSRMNGGGGSQQQLMEKLNYMIHLLEEQQKEPTQHILEEFLLYGLLGIFMIFLVDSFTRVGKYTR